MWAYRYTQLLLQSCEIISVCQSLCLAFVKISHVTEVSFDHCFKAWYDSPGIAVDGCLLTYMGPDFCKKCKDGNPNDTHSAIFKSPFTPETPRFEVRLCFTHTYIHTIHPRIRVGVWWLSAHDYTCRQRERQRERQTDRQTDRQINRQTDRKIDR